MWQVGSVFGKGGFSSLEAPSVYQQMIDYGARTDGQPVYVGFAAPSTATSAKQWLIQKFTYQTIGSNDFEVSRQSVVGAWDDRASLTYS